MNPYIFRNYDIRGIVDKDLDVEKVEAIGKGYGTFLTRRKIHEIVVGRDSRLSGRDYTEAFIRGVVSCGIDVIYLGEVMTQMVYYGQYRFQTNGAAMITASHNPWNFNGFKLAIAFSQTTGPEEVQEIKELIEKDAYFVSEEIGKITTADIKEDYMRDILKRIRLKRKFKVVMDCLLYTSDVWEC